MASVASADDPGAPPGIIASIETGACEARETFVVAVHGGTVWGRHPQRRKVAAIEAVLPALRGGLEAGARAVDIVHAAVVALEDSGAFNAGKGALANHADVVELDASIMDGRTGAAGAVAGVTRLKNPVDAARLVMERSGNVLLIGAGADSFALSNGAESAAPGYFLHAPTNVSDVPLPSNLSVTPPAADLPAALADFSGRWAGMWSGGLNQMLVIERIEAGGGALVYAEGVNEDWGVPEGRWERHRFRIEAGAIVFDRWDGDRKIAMVTYRLSDRDTLAADYTMSSGPTVTGTLQRLTDTDGVSGGGTVGAVALDRCGDLAAALSTGGYGSKRPGRVGDSPVVGAGLYAKNGAAAVAATGQGEFFLRGALAHEVIALIEHGGLSLAEATDRVIHGDLTAAGGNGGFIAIDPNGEVAMPYNTDGMARGVAGSDIAPRVTIY